MGRSGRLVPKKAYIGPASTKTHSGDPDGTGGFGGFLGFWEVPGPEIRILREISSPELAGNVREASGTFENIDFLFF